MREYCEACGKICYSEKEANTIVNSLRNGERHYNKGHRVTTKRWTQKKQPCRSYFCKHCGCYHLTSQDRLNKQ